MRFLGLFLLFTVVLAGFSAQSYAEKANKWGFLYHDGYKHKFEPYMGQEKLRQRSIEDNDTWTPQDWIKNPGDEKIILRDFYTMGILVKQFMDNDIPVLRVGEPFVQLSTFDQRRILAFIDYVFEITTSKKDGMFYIYYEADDNNPLGLYNKYGFQNY